MKRETIKLLEGRDLEGLIYGDSIEGFLHIQSTDKRFDSEKGSTDVEIIIQREADSKYFKGYGLKGSAGYSEVDSKFTEVFPEKVETIIYK